MMLEKHPIEWNDFNDNETYCTKWVYLEIFHIFTKLPIQILTIPDAIIPFPVDFYIVITDPTLAK